MDGLLRCPFCGKDVKIRRTRNEARRYEIVHAEPTFCVIHSTWLYDTADEAREVWNKRAIPPKLNIYTKGKR